MTTEEAKDPRDKAGSPVEIGKTDPPQAKENKSIAGTGAKRMTGVDYCTGALIEQENSQLD